MFSKQHDLEHMHIVTSQVRCVRDCLGC